MVRVYLSKSGFELGHTKQEVLEGTHWQEPGKDFYKEVLWLAVA